MVMTLQTLWGAVFLCSIVTASGLAQGSTQDLQQLKAKLQQLEGMMRSLQGEIAAVERAQKAQAPPVSAAPSKPPKMPWPDLPLTYLGEETRDRQVANDDPIDAPRLNNEELDPTLRGFFRLPGTETLVRVRGLVNTDFCYDLNVAGLWYGGCVSPSFPPNPPPNTSTPPILFRPCPPTPP